jgi:hypothetical protein
MDNLNLLNHRVSVAFSSYLQQHITLDQFILQLERIEAQLKQNNSQSSLWFKFADDDSLATTIPDLKKDLSDNRNREFTLERMREAINLENELFIYYS